MKDEDTIIIKTVAEHILAEECRKCCEHSEYRECINKSECLKGWEKEIRSWKDEN